MKGQRVYYYEDDVLKVKISTARYGFCLPFLKDKLVLDVGCGARQGPEILSSVSRMVVGLDISFQAISYCQKHFEKNRISYLVSDATHLPFKGEIFDAVVSFEVIEHIEDDIGFLTQLQRVLKKDGVCYISTPKRIASSQCPVLTNPDHVREYDPNEFKNLLLTFFGQVEIYGQFVSERVRSIEGIKKDSFKLVEKFPSFFKKIFSAETKDALFNWFNRSRIALSGIDTRTISEEDFFFSKADMYNARHLFAICRKTQP